MGEQERNELIGEVLSNHKQKSRELEECRVKAARIGKELARLGGVLEKAPETVTFLNEPHTSHDLGQRTEQFGKGILDLSTVNGLANQIRSLAFEVQQLEEQKKRLGF